MNKKKVLLINYNFATMSAFKQVIFCSSCGKTIMLARAKNGVETVHQCTIFKFVK